MLKRRGPFLVIAFFSFIALWILLSLLILLLSNFTSPSSEEASPLAAPNQTEEALDAVRLPTVTSDLSSVSNISATPTIDAISLQTTLLDIEGISTVRVIDIRGFAEGWLAFLEVDTDSGYVTESTAAAIREATFTLIGEERIQFSVILWDRINQAVNFTWDNASELWLTTTLVNNPG
jgi:hypothetical protein